MTARSISAAKSAKAFLRKPAPATPIYAAKSNRCSPRTKTPEHSFRRPPSKSPRGKLSQTIYLYLTATSPAAPQLIGRELANYRIISLLGRGGMGEVYLAEDTRLHRKVALKLLPPQFTNDADRVRRFEREARAVSALNHPNIVTIFDIGQAGGLWFMATEFIEGQTLRQVLAESKRTATA